MGCNQSTVLEVELADTNNQAIAAGYTDLNTKDMAVMLRQGACSESFDPVSVEQYTGAIFKDVDAIAYMPSVARRTSMRDGFGLKSSPTGSQHRQSAFFAMQATLHTDQAYVPRVTTRAAGVKHIGYGPYKSENQDEYFIQVGGVGGCDNSNLFCIFDGHGCNGRAAAAASCQHLPTLLDRELTTFFKRLPHDEPGLKGGVELLLGEAFAETERAVADGGVDLSCSGTTAAVALQRGNQVWLAAAGDSRAVLCSRGHDGNFRCQPLSLDHRPSRPSETERVVAAGARVQPQRLPSGRSIGEARMWLRQSRSPGLLVSRSLGDLMAATVGCTSDPEVSFTALRPHMDEFLVVASDGVWDVLTNQQVCDLVIQAHDPDLACHAVLDAALLEWEQRNAADNISVVVAQFVWDDVHLQGAAVQVPCSEQPTLANGRAVLANGLGAQLASHHVHEDSEEESGDMLAMASVVVPELRFRREHDLHERGDVLPFEQSAQSDACNLYTSLRSSDMGNIHSAPTTCVQLGEKLVQQRAQPQEPEPAARGTAPGRAQLQHSPADAEDQPPAVLQEQQRPLAAVAVVG